MKIIDAVWEKRNLGCDVCEIELATEDDIIDVSHVLQKVSTPYSVVKCPVGNFDLLMCVQENGYKVVETSIMLEGKSAKIELPNIYQRFKPMISFRMADDFLMQKMLDEIQEGKIFSTDRIAIDPIFSPEIAGRRYCNWAKDEIEKGAKVSIAYYKDEPVAFGISKKIDENKYDAFLGGVFKESANKGLGFMAIQANNEMIILNGGKTIVTHVSSNNLPILRLHMQFGYEIKDMQYILVKHEGEY